ncbi:MAG: glycosyltransferase family 2 protein [bacterium]|nr:glycosyltransferase family 2 protein [bacterium]
MLSSPRVAVIVLNYNGKECLPRCLNSLAQLEYSNREIIIVDNHSSDDSLLVAEKTFPQLTFIRNAENAGFAKGMNIGIRAALAHGAEWCWLINYDTEIDRSALTRLIAAAQKFPNAGLLSPVIYEKESNRPWFAKGRVDFFRMRAIHVAPTRKDLSSDSYPSEFLTGCALLIKKELIGAIGFLDERFFLYYEDADYSLRAASAGFACLVVSGARVRHSEVSQANPGKKYFLVYSGLLFFEKHAPLFLRPYLWLYVTIRRVKNRLDVVLKNSPAALEVRRAYQHFFHER